MVPMYRMSSETPLSFGSWKFLFHLLQFDPVYNILLLHLFALLQVTIFKVLRPNINLVLGLHFVIMIKCTCYETYCSLIPFSNRVVFKACKYKFLMWKIEEIFKHTCLFCYLFYYLFLNLF